MLLPEAPPAARLAEAGVLGSWLPRPQGGALVLAKLREFASVHIMVLSQWIFFTWMCLKRGCHNMGFHMVGTLAQSGRVGTTQIL